MLPTADDAAAGKANFDAIPTPLTLENERAALQAYGYRTVPPPPPVIAAAAAIDRLGNADTKDVQQIAATQIKLLDAYHQMALKQSSRSFSWALVGSGFGLLFFAVAVGFTLVNELSLASKIVPLIAGAVVNVVSIIVFVLYGRTSAQLSAFHSRLEVLQRYLLANSICEGLSETERDKARTALIAEIARTQPMT